ncbi:MAG: asparagine synthase (glutamine-hydrolyzing) [Cyanobacteria bacterium]|nr:asparagine synthase (glutamine-hydrolyzing) [Cyanobacteriota bacterium]
MCGIVGFVGEGNTDHLQAMMNRLFHRGPDDQGVYIDSENAVYLGHLRLAILDIEGGKQPMWNQDETIGIVFNGEIYNHQELRRRLEAKGYAFQSSHSDTEVLVYGYQEWGRDLPAMLNGMFAFTIYDKRKKQLFLARDRFGEKPLYYSYQKDWFAFSSEMSGFYPHPRYQTAPNNHALQKFFAYGYIPAPLTPIQHTYKLKPGHFMVFDIPTQSIDTQAYWQFNIQSDPHLIELPEDTLAEELRELVMNAVRRRLVSDVPLGVFLSGGVDSSSILAAICQFREPSSVKTFTIGFNEASYNESHYAQEVAFAFGTDHRDNLLDINTARNVIPTVLGGLDEPIGDSSILPTYLLCKFCKENVTVALSGDGADELFAGYDPFIALNPSSQYANAIPHWLHQLFRKGANLLPISNKNMSLDFKLRRTLMGLSYPPSLWNPVWMSPVEPMAMGDLFGDPLPPELLYEEAITLWDRLESKHIVDKSLEFYTQFYLQENILRKVDRAGMMVSLESRAVFLDNDLVDFCQRLPHSWKFRNGERKYLLKKAMADLLPETVLKRPKKGFGIPLAKWLRELPFPEQAVDIPGINTAFVKKAWEDHRKRKVDHRLLLWGWLSLQYSLGQTFQHTGKTGLINQPQPFLRSQP